MIFIVLIISSYLLGSIPFGLLIAKAHGKDLRTIGSGNIGATNVARALGRRWAYLCFLLDMLKGALPMLIIGNWRLVIGNYQLPITSYQFLWLWLAAGCAAILGHIFPIYLKFKGGKGVATSLGVALGLWPYYTICALFSFAVWATVVFIWRYISLASIIASITFPLVLIGAMALIPNWDFVGLWPLLIVACIIPLIVIIRHRENIKRLIAGTESKILK